jgi:hypothetical protein
MITKINTSKVEEKEVVTTTEVKSQNVEKEEVVAPIKEEKKTEEKTSEYEIVEVDGLFKVRKVGSERTIRKFITKKEAVEYVKEKEND